MSNTTKSPILENARKKHTIFNKEVLSWCLWDLGSASFNAVVTTFIFSVYLTSKAFGDTVYTSESLGYGFTVAGFLIALLAPLSGQRADKAGKGTFWLGVNSFIVIACIFALFFIKPDPSYLWAGIILLSAGHVFFEFASVNYNAMLTRISTPKNIGTISGIGWGAGYFGGIVLLMLLYLGFIKPDVGWFGVTSDNGLDVRVSMIFAGIWMLVATIPVLFVVRGRKQVEGAVPRISLLQSYKDLWATLKLIKREAPQTFLFLVASAIFRDGIAAVFSFGAVIAAGTFGFSSAEVLFFGVITNVVAGVATVLFGFFDDWFGPKRVILVSLVCMCFAGVCIFVFADKGSLYFWIFGLLLSVFVGPIQSASRSYLARLIPEGREGEVFGLYATTGRAVSFIAPWAFAVSIWIGRTWFDSQLAQSWGILGITSVLLLGLLIMFFVKENPKGKLYE